MHKYSSVLSAYGIALANIGIDVTEPSVEYLTMDSLPRVLARRDLLKEKASKSLLSQGVKADRVYHTSYLNLRYEGTDTSLMIKEPEDGDFVKAFTDRHRREFSFVSDDKKLIIDDIRVTGTGQGEDVAPVAWSANLEHVRKNPIIAPQAVQSAQIYFEEASGYVDSPLYNLSDLPVGTVVHGPAIILDATQTIVVFPANEATILNDLVHIDVGLGPRKQLDTGIVDPIILSIFGNR